MGLDPASRNTVSEVAPGVWCCHFPTVDLVKAVHCGELVAVLAEACKKTGKIVLLADVPHELRLVDPSMVPFWRDAMSKGGVNVKGIGVQTTSRAVNMVLNGLGLVLRINGQDVQTATFGTREALIAWAVSI